MPFGTEGGSFSGAEHPEAPRGLCPAGRQLRCEGVFVELRSGGYTSLICRRRFVTALNGFETQRTQRTRRTTLRRSIPRPFPRIPGLVANGAHAFYEAFVCLCVLCVLCVSKKVFAEPT